MAFDWARSGEYDNMYGVYNTSYGYQPYSTFDYLNIAVNREETGDVVDKYIDNRMNISKEIKGMDSNTQGLPRVNPKLATTQAQTSGSGVAKGNIFRVKRKSKYL